MMFIFDNGKQIRTFDIDKNILPVHLQHKKVLKSPYAYSVFQQCLQALPVTNKQRNLLPMYINCCKHFNLDAQIYEQEFASIIGQKKTPERILTFFLQDQISKSELVQIKESFSSDFLQKELEILEMVGEGT